MVIDDTPDRMVLKPTRDHASTPFEKDHRVIPEDRGFDGEYTIQFQLRNMLPKYLCIFLLSLSNGYAFHLIRQTSHITQTLLMAEGIQLAIVMTLEVFSRLAYSYKTYHKDHQVCLRGFL